MRSTTATGPSYWASYIINGDPSALGEDEIAQVDAWQASLHADGWAIVEIEEDSECFAWYCDAYGARRFGADICTYQLLSTT